MNRLFFSLVLVLVIVFAGVVFAGGPNKAEIFSDCYFYESLPTFTASDTLWFDPHRSTTLNVLDYRGPEACTVRVLGDGSRVSMMLPVRKVLMYSIAPFSYMGHCGGQVNQANNYTLVDTVNAYAGGAVVGPHDGTKYPCWSVIMYPDSLWYKEIGDSISVDLGY